VKPLVSILIPAFNAGEWISGTLSSAVAQTWPHKEIIVVDDGSSDQTVAVAKRFEAAGVRVVSQANQGAAAARNQAYALSQGDYVQWLDADDLLGPDKIARQLEALQACPNPRTLLSSEWGQFMYRAHRAKFVPSALWCDLSRTEWLLRKMGQNLHMQTATWLVSRELTEAAGPWDTRLLGDDDGEYFCRVLLASDGVRFVPGAKVFYRATGTSSLSYIGRSSRKLEAQWRSMQLHIRYLRSLNDSERVHAVCLRYLQNWSTPFYPGRLDLVEQMQQMAKELGGELKAPRLSWKYSWIEPIFGLDMATRVQVALRRSKWSVVRRWDEALARREQRKHRTLAE
jgi:glycosyltransferase involved in cell wall biosynthesis